MHYHKLHSSTQTKHTCHNCLISDAVYLDKLKLQAQTDSSCPVVRLGLITLGAQTVCFAIDVIDIVQHS